MWETIPVAYHNNFNILDKKYLTLLFPYLIPTLLNLAVCIHISYLQCIYTCTGPHFVTVGWVVTFSLSPPTVSGFSYYQFYCFQDTENLFNRFDSEEDSLTDFLNSTETLSARLCVQTEVFRSFISSQLPWFRYQKETWLAIGEMQCPTLWCAFLLHGWYMYVAPIQAWTQSMCYTHFYRYTPLQHNNVLTHSS